MAKRKWMMHPPAYPCSHVHHSACSPWAEDALFSIEDRGHDFACFLCWTREVAEDGGKCMSWPQAAEYNMITNKLRTVTFDRHLPAVTHDCPNLGPFETSTHSLFYNSPDKLITSRSTYLKTQRQNDIPQDLSSSISDIQTQTSTLYPKAKSLYHTHFQHLSMTDLSSHSVLQVGLASPVRCKAHRRLRAE